MDFIHWMLVAEDVIMALVILALFSLRKFPYTIIGIINTCVLLFVNVLLFQKNVSAYFLVLPVVTSIFTLLIVRPFVSQDHSGWNVKTTRIVISALVITMLILIIMSIILAFKLL